MAKITSESIKGMIIVVVMAVIFFSMAPSLLHTFGLGVGSLLTEVQNSSVYGTGPASLGSVLENNWGYFLLVGILILIISLSSGLFKTGGRR